MLSRILGICPFIGVSKRVETAVGMGFAVTFVMALASVICWIVQKAILDPLDIGYMQTIAFILVIAALVQLVEMALQKMVPSLYQALGIYLPLITTNCAVLGVAILNIDEGYNLIQTLVTHGGALGFLLAIVLFAGIRERMELVKYPNRSRTSHRAISPASCHWLLGSRHRLNGKEGYAYAGRHIMAIDRAGRPGIYRAWPCDRVKYLK